MGKFTALLKQMMDERDQLRDDAEARQVFIEHARRHNGQARAQADRWFKLVKEARDGK